MAGRNNVSSRSGWVAALLLGALLAMAAWLRPVTAQDATPDASPAGSPGAAAAVDCAEVLGIGLPGDGCLRVVHASPDAPAVAVFIDEQNAVTSLAFGRATPGFVAILPGEHRIRVAPVASAADPAPTPVIDETVTIEPGQAYEIAAIGTLDAIEALISPVDLGPVGPSAARLRVIQAIPDAPVSDVAVAGGDVLIPGITFGVATDYVEVPAEATPVDLEVRAEGLAVAIPLPSVTLSPGLVYSIYPVGRVAEPWTIAVLVVAAPASGIGSGTPVPGPSSLNLELATPPATPAA